MKFEIKHRFTGKVLFSLETKSLKLCVEAAIKQGAYLRGAYLRDAYLQGANLQGAYLRNADLQGANLQDAYLRDANLQGADLQGAYLRNADLRNANLQDAYLRDAKNISKYWTTNLYFLKDQIGKIRAYKLVNEKNEGPYNGGIVYEIGKTVSVKNADCNENIKCSRGISLADLLWCIKEWRKGFKILVAEFTAKDIAAIPVGSDGKFRVHKCKIVGEKDLKELGLTK